jgi:hypothetical protein
MKQLLFISTLMLFVVSCEEQQISKQESLPETVTHFRGSQQFSLIKANFTSLSSTLSFNAYWRENIEGKEIFAVPSIKNNTINGVLYFDQNFNVIVETRSFSENSAFLSFRDLNNNELVNWTGSKRGESYVFSYDELANNYTKSQANGRSTSCTSDCYSKAKKACEADSECDMMCDLTPGCHVSIAVACFIHCW